MGAYSSNNIFLADIHKHILHASTYQELYEYLKIKHTWNDTQMTSIAWDSLEKVLESYQPYQRTKIAQLMHHWQYIGERKTIIHEQDGKEPCSKLLQI